MPAPSHVALRKVVLNAARSKEFPEGSIRHGYDFIAPFDWRRPHRSRSLAGANRGRVFRPNASGGGEPVDARAPRPSRGRPRRLDLGPSEWKAGSRDEPEEEGFRFGDHAFRVGEYVSVREEEGESF